MKTNSVDPLIAPGQPGEHERTNKPRSASELERFKRQMSTEKNTNKNPEQSKEHTPESLTGEKPGEAILKSFLNREQKNAQLQSTNTVKLSPALSQMVDRILVSVPKAGESAEVRIHVNSELLGSTEIRLQRLEGALQVQVLTPTIDAERTVLQLKGGLQQTLQEKIPEVQVKVDVSSQGLTQDHQQGRSRNPYIMSELAEGEDEGDRQNVAAINHGVLA